MSANAARFALSLAMALAGTFAADGADVLSRSAGQSEKAFAVAAREWKPIDERQRETLARVIEAYPGEITSVEAGVGKTVTLKMRAGASVPFDDGKTKTHDQRLADSDVEDMFADVYPGDLPAKWPMNLDPGRYRSAPFFKALYGDSEAAVGRDLATVRFCGQTVRFSKHCGAADALTAVGREVESLVARDPALKKHVTKLGGGFNWRQVAQSEAMSAHSFGIAIDLNPDHGDYWQWSKGDKGDMTKRKGYPAAIVEAFERHGFVWGGKWYHFDLMHFEYRPELLRGRPIARKADAAPALESNTALKPTEAETPNVVGQARTPETSPGPLKPEPPKAEDDAVKDLLFDAAFDVSPYQSYSRASKVGILRMVQARLAYEGSYGGPLNGAYDETTQHAIRAWQKEKAIASNGLLDEATLGSLGLMKLTEARGKVPQVGTR